MTLVATRTKQDIEQDIVRELNLADTIAYNAAQHAINCGEFLAEMKDHLGHGYWETWVQDVFPYSLKTASNWIRLAANRQSVADLDVAAGLKLLAQRDSEERTTTREVTNDLKDQMDAPIEATAIVENDSPELKAIEEAFATVIRMLVEARSLVGVSAFERLDEALGVASSTTRTLKAYVEGEG